MATQACNRCTRIPYALFQIFSFSALTATITCVILAYHMYDVWKADWKNQRCKLHVMPFASIIQPNKSVVDNYKECMKMKLDIKMDINSDWYKRNDKFYVWILCCLYFYSIIEE